MNYEKGVWPDAMIDIPQWVTWRVKSGRKQPHCLFADTDNKWSWSNPSNWGTFDEASGTAQSVPFMEGVGFIIQSQEEPYREPVDDLMLVDFDDVRDPDTGDMHPVARRYINQAGTYADISTSGTGAHLIGSGTLPKGVRTIQDDLPDRDGFPDAEIEVYDGKRFTAMTGYHIEGTPEDVYPVVEFVEMLADKYTTTDETETKSYDLKDIDNDDYADVDLTDDVDDLNDAIDSIGPKDITLRSKQTNGRDSGVIDYDPSYRSSGSGAGLAWFNKVGAWVERDGMHYMDALKLVAVEEGIISGPAAAYPTGEDYWKAVERLRERGANVPRYSKSEIDRKKKYKRNKSVSETLLGMNPDR